MSAEVGAAHDLENHARFSAASDGERGSFTYPGGRTALTSKHSARSRSRY